MNILIVSAMFPPIRTGTSYYTKNVAEGLKNLGHDVSLVTLENQFSNKDKYNYPVYRLPAARIPLKNYFKHLRLSAIYRQNYSKILKIAKKQHSEVIYLINHYQDIAFPAIYAAKKLKIPIVIAVATQIQSLDARRDKILNFFDRLICGRFIFSNCQKIIALDREIQRYLKAIHGPEILTKTTIVPYGPNGDMSQFLKYRHDYQSTRQIIGVGAIIEQRNFFFLIKLFNQLQKNYPDLRLKIIGHIYYQDTVKLIKKLKLEKKVALTGEQSHEKVLQELKKSVFYWGMLTGKYVGLGIATLEAMLLGVPIVSNVPENLLGKIYLKDMESFIYSDGKNLDLTLKKLKLLLERNALRKKIGQNGRQFVQKNLSWSVIAKDLATVLKETINKHR